MDYIGFCPNKQGGRWLTKHFERKLVVIMDKVRTVDYSRFAWTLNTSEGVGYTYLIVPTEEGIFNCLSVFSSSGEPDENVASELLAQDVCDAVLVGNVSVNRLHAVQAYRLLLGLANGESSFDELGLTVDDFASHPHPLIRQAVAISTDSLAIHERLLVDPELSVQFVSAICLDWLHLDDNLRGVAKEAMSNVLLDPSVGEKAVCLAMASPFWQPTVLAATFAWDKLPDEVQEEWLSSESSKLWAYIASCYRMKSWSQEAVLARTATTRSRWRDWYEVFGIEYMSVVDAYRDFEASYSSAEQKLGG